MLGGEAAEPGDPALGGQDLGMDQALEALYDTERSGGLGSSSPNVARWLGDIRTYFPAPAVRVMQQDALERLNLRRCCWSRRCSSRSSRTCTWWRRCSR